MAPSWGLNIKGTNGNTNCCSDGRDTTPVVWALVFVNGFSAGKQVSIVFYRRNNGMPKKGVIEKTEATMGDFLWMPDVVTPLYDIMKSLLQTAKIVGLFVISGFIAFVYYSLVIDLRKTPYPWTISLIVPAIAIIIAIIIVLIVIVAIGYFFAPLKIFGIPILTSYPYTCPPTHPELNGLLCYKPCPAGRHRVSDVCWADSKENGLGTAVGLEPCPDEWNNWGLVCQHPISCYSIDDCFKHGKCGCSGGELVGRLDHGGVCPGPEDAGGLPYFDDWYKRWKTAFDKKPRTKKKCSEPPGVHDNERSCDEEKLVTTGVHTERVDGMCYKPCPSGMSHVPGMPYLCVKTESNGKPMRLDYYDADSKVPSLIQLFGAFNPI